MNFTNVIGVVSLFTAALLWFRGAPPGEVLAYTLSGVVFLIGPRLMGHRGG